MRSLLKLMDDTEGIRLEPSALAGAFGPTMLAKNCGVCPKGYHLIWATGGNMVPRDEHEKYYNEGERVFDKY